MIHLGVCTGHNATVAVIADGHLVFCQSEERLNRIKNATGAPRQTLNHVYSMLGGVERIASCGVFQRFAYGYLHHGYIAAPTGTAIVSGNPLDFATIEGWRRDLDGAVAAELAAAMALAASEREPATQAAGRAAYADALGFPADRLVELHHHDSHAYSTLPFLPPDGREPVLILTLDGEGDGACASVSRWEGGRMVRLSSTPDLCSLGRIYGYVTNILGFRMLEHEYKIMGLAPYAKPEHGQELVARLHTLLWVDAAGQWRAGYRSPCELAVALAELCAFQRLDNIAAALQSFTEEMMARWVAHWVAATGIGTVACAGGVFMNVKANQLVAALPGVTRLIVTPSSGDESCAIGAAVFASLTAEPATPIARLDNIYLGLNYVDEAVEQAFRAAAVGEQFVISEPPDINRAVAELLARNEVVGRCSGRMEFGARALGNRSILANPSDPATVDFINRAIKNRDFWMPFAPSILAEAIDELVEDPKDAVSPYMMVSAPTTARGRVALAAAIHRADGTARPQRVERAANPDYHALIGHFRRLTGVGAVLNTSFNLHGEPIVCTPLDAVDTMRRSGLRWLAVNRFLLEKRPAGGGNQG
jgi:carbamoyltransferase